MILARAAALRRVARSAIGSERSGSAILLAAQVAAAAGALASTVIVARTLGPAGRGAYAFAVTTAFAVSIVGQAGRTTALSYLNAKDPQRARFLRRLYLVRAGGTTVMFGAIVVTVLVFFAPDDLLDRHSVIVLLPVALAVTAFEGAFAMRNSERRFAQAGAMLALGGVAPALVVALLLPLGWLTVTSALGAWGAVRAMIAFVGWLRPALPVGHEVSEEVPVEFHRYARRAFAASAAGVITLRADGWMLGLISGGSALGLYAVATSMIDPFLYLPTALQRTLFPKVAATPERAVELTSKAVRMSVWSGVGFLLIAGPVSVFLLPYVFGSAFAPAETLYLILIPGTLGISVLIPTSAAIAAVGRPGLASVIEIGTSVVMLSLDGALMPTYAATGAAIACSCAYVAGGTVSLVAFKRLHHGQPMRLVPVRADLAILTNLSRRRPRISGAPL